MATTAQRVYRADCPNCGAPVEFRSPASAFAVCSFCQSTLVRDGDALRKIGQSAELFDDHSPLQLGASGRYQGAAFTLVGRLQYRYVEGTWNEWHALFDAGDGAAKSAWLSEDNGRYVIAFDLPLDGPAPAAESLRAGQQVMVGGQPWSVASVSAAQLIAARGELPVSPNLTRGFVVSDLRNTRGEVGTLDYGEPGAAPRWSIGRSTSLAELAMSGLADAADKTLKARAIECPNCGAALEIKLATTQTIVCHQCHSVIDLSGVDAKDGGAGMAGDLKHYAQQNGMAPLLSLGSTGTLALGGTARLPWQVVGYVERCELAESDGDEQSFWREYLLFHRTEGFAFIVDAEDGWSWSAPITGVPERAGEGAKYQGVVYRKLYDYTGVVTYVLGEFYWQVTKGQRTANSDFQGTGSAAAKRLNREATAAAADAQEVVWSAGETLTSEQVLQAFKLPIDQAGALRRDATPTTLSTATIVKIVIALVVLLPIVLLLFTCSGGDARDCAATRSTYGAASQEYQRCVDRSRSGGYRTGGGAFGGFSSGGGGSHK